MKGRVLIVDDDTSARILLRRILERAGFEPYDASDGRAALQLLEGEHRLSPDLVLLDIALPDMSGLEVLGQLSHMAPGLPVVMVAQHRQLEQGVEAMRQGAFDALAKPFSSAEVLLRVERALERSALKRKVEELSGLKITP